MNFKHIYAKSEKMIQCRAITWKTFCNRWSLAGCEAAWQAAKRGLTVSCMRCARSDQHPPIKPEIWPKSFVPTPRVQRFPPLHRTLMHELAAAGFPFVECAQESRVPAGHALAVDRENSRKKFRQR
jgi:methylenetetrahydrofolate--tRNA-(uracil-5-)-methyltransferase